MDWSCHEEDGVMRPFKAKCLDGICRNGFTREILNRRPLALRHTLLGTRALMGGKGVSDQSIGSGRVEATLDAVLVLQCLCRDLFEGIGFGMSGSAVLRAWRRGWRSGGRGGRGGGSGSIVRREMSAVQ
jgi:hypothetical protein